MASDVEQAHSTFAEKVSQSLENINHVGEQLQEDDRHEISLLRAAIDELRLQFALGKMEGIETLNKIRSKLDHRFNQAAAKISNLERLPSKEVEKLKGKLHQSWKDLKFEIALLNARITLIEEQGLENFSTAKEEMIADLRLIGHYAKENADELNESIQAWAKKTKKSLKKQGRDFLDTFVEVYEIH